MPEDLILYTNPQSRGRIARWMLEETGAAYRTEVVGYGPAMKTPAYLAINPMGKVPAIVHAGSVVTESPAICAYLAQAFPAARLQPPANSPGWATYYRWLFFAAGPVEAAITNKALGVEVPPDRQRMAGYGNFEQTMDVLEQAVSRDSFLLGDQFTAADVYVGSAIGFGLQFGAIPPRPAFTAYVDRVTARPAYQRAKAIDDQLAAA